MTTISIQHLSRDTKQRLAESSERIWQNNNLTNSIYMYKNKNTSGYILHTRAGAKWHKPNESQIIILEASVDNWILSLLRCSPSMGKHAVNVGLSRCVCVWIISSLWGWMRTPQDLIHYAKWQAVTWDSHEWRCECKHCILTCNESQPIYNLSFHVEHWGVGST